MSEQQPPPPFTLKYLGIPDNGLANAHFELTSPRLDVEMHHGRAVYLHGDWPPPPRKVEKTDVPLSPFELNSLHAYLSEQASVRRELEAKFMEEDAPRADLWAHAVVRHLVLDELRVPTPEEIKGRRDWLYKKKSLEEVAALFDKPHTRTKYSVVLRVDWDDEHPRTAHFRDGAIFDWSWG